MGQCRVIVNIQVPENIGKFLSDSTTGGFFNKGSAP
jgi:hypothetical protein